MFVAHVVRRMLGTAMHCREPASIVEVILLRYELLMIVMLWIW